MSEQNQANQTEAEKEKCPGCGEDHSKFDGIQPIDAIGDVLYEALKDKIDDAMVSVREQIMSAMVFSMTVKKPCQLLVTVDGSEEDMGIQVESTGDQKDGSVGTKEAWDAVRDEILMQALKKRLHKNTKNRVGEFMAGILSMAKKQKAA